MMRASQFQHWLWQIHQTEAEEISCSECFDLISQYVDLEVAGEDVQEKLPKVRQHLDQCRVCHEEYELLRDLAQFEAGKHSHSTD